jgi:DHA2 family multidrug resistance protein
MSADAVGARGPITAGIMLATVMSSLDTTVVNIALPHLQGSLSASPEQITWVLTSYIVATAVTMPISGWLAARVGLKPLLITCIIGFTVTSILCGLATSLPAMVAFRLLQGITAAPIAPLSQTVLFNINPPERYGRAMALFTMGAVAAPVVGPVVGGYLTDNLSWRWCFYINIPAGIGAVALLWLFLPKEAPAPRRFDFLGFGSLAIAVAAFQLMMDRGPSRDWFGSTEICVEAMIAAACFWVYVTHTLTTAHPLFDRSLARDRNFVVSLLFNFTFSLLIYCSLTLLPLMMQGVMGYSVMVAGIVSMPRGVIMMAVLQVMGRLDSLFDRRLLLGVGWCLLAAGFLAMARFDLSMGPETIVAASALQGLGQGMIAVPLSTLAFATLNPALRAEASAISNLMRFLAGSVGIATMQALTSMNGQAMHASLAARIRLDDPAVRAGLPPFLWPGSEAGALALNEEITRQATMVAYVDDFLLMFLLCAIGLPLILLFRKPPATHPAALVASLQSD